MKRIAGFLLALATLAAAAAGCFLPGRIMERKDIRDIQMGLPGEAVEIHVEKDPGSYFRRLRMVGEQRWKFNDYSSAIGSAIDYQVKQRMQTVISELGEMARLGMISEEMIPVLRASGDVIVWYFTLIDMETMEIFLVELWQFCSPDDATLTEILVDVDTGKIFGIKVAGGGSGTLFYDHNQEDNWQEKVLQKYGDYLGLPEGANAEDLDGDTSVALWRPLVEGNTCGTLWLQVVQDENWYSGEAIYKSHAWLSISGYESYVSTGDKERT